VKSVAQHSLYHKGVVAPGLTVAGAIERGSVTDGFTENTAGSGEHTGAESASGKVLSVIMPARNEAARLRACLASLIAESEPGWLLGEHWELLVVDDGSTDQTIEIARSFAGVTVLSARTPLPHGWTGKANACWTGAETAQGQWLLFTDAGTVYALGTTGKAIVEADRFKVGMLSYAPLERHTGVLQQALMPMVLAELATAYAPVNVNDPAKRVGYADGRFVLTAAEEYRRLGGYASVDKSLKPEVDLAFLAKRTKTGLRYRYAPEALSVVDDRDFGAAWTGWTRKFALLVNNALALAAWRALDVLLLWGLLLLAILYQPPYWWETAALWLLWLRTVLRVWRRTARSKAPAGEIALSLVLGLPLFAALCYASWYRVKMLKRVAWRGREYKVDSRVL
jgi:glycosyltransferase involved in cell wall biosynthesis